MAPKKKTKPETAAAVWQVMGDDNAWTAFPEVDSSLIEQHFRTGVAAFITSALSFNKGFDSKYIFDFAKMTQTNLASEKKRDISRIAPPDEFTWEWQDDTNNFVGFYDEDVNLIEKLFQDAGVNKPTLTKNFSFNKGFGSTYELVFTSQDSKTGVVTGEQTNKDSGKKRTIRRSRKKQPWDTATYGMTAAEAAKQVEAAKAVEAAPPPPPPSAGAPVAAHKGSWLDPPAFWLDPKPFSSAKLGEYVTKAVAPNSVEFASIAGKFADDLKGAVVTNLERIENTMLWGFYAINRKGMVDRNGGNLADANEQHLYFAESSLANIKTIMKLGFDVRVAAATGLTYGDGLYFFKDPNKAGKALQHPDGTREMLIVRFAAGKIANGSKGVRRPPPLDPKKPTMALHDSCVDDVKNPGIFVLFLNGQAYPEYVIRYKTA